MIRTIEWTDQGVVMIDQRLLPGEEVYNTYSTVEKVAEAIRSMVIRGAPAIGVAAAMGVAWESRIFPQKRILTSISRRSAACSAILAPQRATCSGP